MCQLVELGLVRDSGEKLEELPDLPLELKPAEFVERRSCLQCAFRQKLLLAPGLTIWPQSQQPMSYDVLLACSVMTFEFTSSAFEAITV
ncbi:hypothetical protein RB195_001948 [Necator americanus]|uniref:Uncharacterized protein n=1 Tax=Necator americanus TaxID=51031 RepID=A0ABR1DGP4_NECAM